MLVESNPNAGLVSIIIVLLVAGLIMGLAVSDTELFNPVRRTAEVRAAEQADQTAAEKAAIDVELYRAAQAAEAEKLRLEVEATKLELEQNLRLVELARYVWLAVASISLVTLSAGLSTSLVLYTRNHLTTTTTTSSGTWRDPDWRKEQFRLAREHAKQQAPATAHVNHNGHH